MEALKEILKGILYGSPQGISKKSLGEAPARKLLRKSLRESSMEILEDSSMEALRGILYGILYGSAGGILYGNPQRVFYRSPCGRKSLWKSLS